jgi:hypothetical protein
MQKKGETFKVEEVHVVRKSLRMCTIVVEQETPFKNALP